MNGEMEDIEDRTAMDTPETIGQKRPNGKLKAVLFGALALAVLAGAGLYLYYQNRVSTDNAQVDGHIMPVASKIYGNIADVLVDDNQAVKAGQVLVRIDARDYEVKVEQARAALDLAERQAQAARAGVPLTAETTTSGTSGAAAQLAAAQADYARSKAAYDQAAGAEIDYARSNIESKQATADRAAADLERMRPLAAKTEISRLQLDAYVAAAKVAQGELKAAQDRLAAARQNADTLHAAVLAAQAKVAQARAGLAQSRAGQREVGVVSAQAEAAAAGVEQARANLQAAQLQLSYAAIVSPADGVVTKKSVEPGQIVQPGQGLLVLIPLNDIWVTANFKETQLGQVHTGQRAEVDVDMYGKTYTGRVDSIAGATGARLSLLPPENATGNFVKVVQRIPVKIVLDPLPAGAVLRPGMNVDATIFTR